MLKFLKSVKAFVAAGFASAADKAALEAEFNTLSAEEKEIAQADLDTVKGLPATKEAVSPEGDIAAAVKELLGPAIKAEVAAMRSDMEAKVNAFLADQKEQKEKKAGLFNPDVRERRAALNSSLRKTLSSALLGDERALAELAGVAGTKELTTDASGSPYGGYAVTFELSAEIRALITEYGVARSAMTTVQLSKNSYKANNLATDVTVYWVDEANTIGSTQIVLGQEDLELKKLGAIATLTSELIADEEVDLFAFIASRVAQGFARAEDQAFFIGDGTSTYGSFTGVLLANDVNSVVMGAVAGEAAANNDSFFDLSADDLLDMQDASPQVVASIGTYYMHRSIRNIVRKLKAATTGEYIYQQPAGGSPGTVWGRPIVEVEVMPSVADDADDTPFIVFGDLKRACIFGYKGAIAVQRFNAGIVRNVANNADINLITSDREAIRWTERVGYVRILPTAITVLKTATTGS